MRYQNIVFGRVASTNINLALLPYMFSFSEVFVMAAREKNNCVSYLTYRGPCIVIYSYNRHQQDALFLNFILVNNSTCFGQIYCPSSGVLELYLLLLVLVVLVMLTVLLNSLADSQN